MPQVLDTLVRGWGIASQSMFYVISPLTITNINL